MEVKEKSIIKSEKGITLIALVVTIVVLLILAAVSISMLGGENGIITKAIEAKENYEKESTNEQDEMNNATDIIDGYFNRKVFIDSGELYISNKITWDEFLNETKENMESYNIQFKGTSSIEHKEYTEKLGEWYKDFYKKDFEDLGDTIVWHRIIQYYVHDKSKLESGSYAIYKINKDLYDKIINGEVSEEELIIERVKLSDEIDYNCFYFISIDYAL